MTESNAAAPLLYESHMHTPLCRHSVGEPEGYAEVAAQRGLKGIIVTCHNPLPNGMAPGLAVCTRSSSTSMRWWRGHARLGRTRRCTAGLEADYLPGWRSFWCGSWIRPSSTMCWVRSIRNSRSTTRAIHRRILAFQRTYFDLAAPGR